MISELKASHGKLIDKYEVDLKDNMDLIIKKDKELDALKAKVSINEKMK
ncbi:hypothetical protein [Photobacterium kishitanii]|nr:hypothetical protein [Photobacterium kishitanii]